MSAWDLSIGQRVVICGAARGRAAGWTYGIVQEVNLRTGRVLVEWCSLQSGSSPDFRDWVDAGSLSPKGV